MKELIKLFFDISLFKKGPQDIPFSAELLYLLVFVNVGINFLTLILNTDLMSAVLQVSVGILLVLAYAAVVLSFANKSERYIQTVCALTATDSIITFIAIPVMFSLMDGGSLDAFFLIVFLMLWQWGVAGFVFSQALGEAASFGLGIAFIYIFFSYWVMGVLFPEIIIME